MLLIDGTIYIPYVVCLCVRMCFIICILFYFFYSFSHYAGRHSLNADGLVAADFIVFNHLNLSFVGFTHTFTTNLNDNTRGVGRIKLRQCTRFITNDRCIDYYRYKYSSTNSCCTDQHKYRGPV